MKGRNVYVDHLIVKPDNVKHFLAVNPGAFEVTKCRGGWKPVDKNRWFGPLPMAATWTLTGEALVVRSPK